MVESHTKSNYELCILWIGTFFSTLVALLTRFSCARKRVCERWLCVCCLFSLLSAHNNAYKCNKIKSIKLYFRLPMIDTFVSFKYYFNSYCYSWSISSCIRSPLRPFVIVVFRLIFLSLSLLLHVFACRSLCCRTFAFLRCCVHLCRLSQPVLLTI